MTHDPREVLEPCPFCGANAAFTMREGHRFEWQTTCTECHCGTPASFETKELAEAAWNARAITASAPKGEANPPPAAGWDEATRYLQKIADLVDDENACDPLDDAISYANKALKALRREAPGSSGVADTTIPDSSDMDARFAWLESKAIDMGYVLVPEPEHPDSPHRPDAGGGVRALPDWGQLVQILLRCMDATIKNESSREQAERMADELLSKYPALSTPSDAGRIGE